MGLMFIFSSSPASMSGGCSTGFPNRRRLKCSFQRSSWFTGLVSVPPCSPRTVLSELDLVPDSFLVISYSVFVSFLVAASCALQASWSILLLLSWLVLRLTSFCCSLYSFWLPVSVPLSWFEEVGSWWFCVPLSLQWCPGLASSCRSVPEC